MAQEGYPDAEVAGESRSQPSPLQPGPPPTVLAKGQVHSLIDTSIQGDAVMAAQLLALLNSSDLNVQLLAGAELEGVTNPLLWERLIEVLAVGRWAGQPIDVPSDDSPAGRRLRRRIQSAFLPYPDAPAEMAKREAVLTSLRSALPAIRMVAADLAALRGDRTVVDDLVKALVDPALPVREHAALALGCLDGKSAIEALIRSLGEQHDVLSRYVTQALIRIGSEAVPSLIAASHSPDDNARWHAAEALAEIGDPRAIETLVDALDDTEAGVRWNAGRGLIKLGKPAVVALLRALETRPLTPSFAHAAGRVLRHVHLPEPRHCLQMVVDALSRPAASVEVPLRAADALAELA